MRDLEVIFFAEKWVRKVIDVSRISYGIIIKVLFQYTIISVVSVHDPMCIFIDGRFYDSHVNVARKLGK